MARKSRVEVELLHGLFCRKVQVKMKKIKALIYIIIVCVSLCGCTAEANYTGKSDIERARKLHTQLDSAKITVTDNISGEVVQQITYSYSGEVMTYMYMARDGEQTYYEYNNGTELDFITLPEGKEWSYYPKGSEEYYGYSRTQPHYFADGERLFAVYGDAVSGCSTTDWGEGGRSFVYYYNIIDLGKYDSLSISGEITDFSMSYRLNGDGYCESFSNMYTIDGTECSYTITVDDMNCAEVKRTEL